VLWIALIVFVLAQLAGIAYAITRAVGAWRTFRGFTSAVGGATGAFAARVDAMASREPFEVDRLGAGVARLQRSAAQLSILMNAVARVRAQWSGLLAVYPRK
jgi:hypothetical protein